MPDNNFGDPELKRFRIAFSFAGEKREFVAKVARILADRFGEDGILYDKFHEAEFANANLAFDLPPLYKNDSDLIVAVFCPDYDRNRADWPGAETLAREALPLSERLGRQALIGLDSHRLAKALVRQ